MSPPAEFGISRDVGGGLLAPSLSLLYLPDVFLDALYAAVYDALTFPEFVQVDSVLCIQVDQRVVVTLGEKSL